VEFLLAGASAVAIGTANFLNPLASIQIIDGLRQYMIRKNIKNLRHIIGKMKRS
jgi:dihydroorotate dehydrogenase (NAD+) catalytic subunit